MGRELGLNAFPQILLDNGLMRARMCNTLNPASLDGDETYDRFELWLRMWVDQPAEAALMCPAA